MMVNRTVIVFVARVKSVRLLNVRPADRLAVYLFNSNSGYVGIFRKFERNIIFHTVRGKPDVEGHVVCLSCIQLDFCLVAGFLYGQEKVFLGM